MAACELQYRESGGGVPTKWLIYKILSDACYVTLIAICLSDFKKGDKANISRLIFIVLLVVIMMVT